MLDEDDGIIKAEYQSSKNTNIKYLQLLLTRVYTKTGNAKYY